MRVWIKLRQEGILPLGQRARVRVRVWIKLRQEGILTLTQEAPRALYELRISVS